MNINILYLPAELILPIAVIMVGVSVWKNPPKMGEQFGFRTKRSQRSEAAWNYAQIAYGKMSTFVFIPIELLTLAVGVTSIVMNFSDLPAFITFMAVEAAQVAALIIITFAVDLRLKKHFDEDGNLR
ncbi:MAG: SdpI family protein [Oscillospiraceae bacterium]|nr:SdpI family protein [Oscillospiraceae bacterium]